MEARKQAQAKEFIYGDLTVLVKPHASSQDRMDVAFSPNDVALRYRLAARLMVVGWKGFTRDNKEVPYSPQELENVPDMPERSFAIELGNFIWKETDLSGLGEEERKNA